MQFWRNLAKIGSGVMLDSLGTRSILLLFAMLVERFFDGIGAMTGLAAVLAPDLLAEPGHGLVGMVECQSRHGGDFECLLPSAGMAVGAGHHQPVEHRQVGGALDVEAETASGQMLMQHRLAAGASPQVAEHQIRANTLAAQFRQLAAVEAGQHNGASGVARRGGDQAVKQAGASTSSRRPSALMTR
jgi:hypothetical protein